MGEITQRQASIPAMTNEAIEKVRALEAQAALQPQIDIPTQHQIHAGTYARTIMIPAGAMITGAQIRIATTLIVSGDAIAYIGAETMRITGHKVIAASAHRKQAFVALTDTYLTMIFATQATTIEQAEEEFTDEAHKLISRSSGLNTITITGE